MLLALLLDLVLGQCRVFSAWVGRSRNDHAVDELLGELHVEILGRNRTLSEDLIGLLLKVAQHLQEFLLYNLIEISWVRYACRVASFLGG